MDILKELLKLKDEEYKKFHAKLMPTVDSDKIIGVRTPELRKLAKEYFISGEFIDFLITLPHEYYEENNVHAVLIEQIRDFDDALYLTEEFLPYIDNWATCDMMMPKALAKNKEKLSEKIFKWIKSGDTYTIRFAVGLLMKLYLDEDFDVKYLKAAAEIKSEEYYVNMMIAWYFATALAKQYDKTIPFIEKKKLSPWVHNKTIRKAVESNRISPETKEYLKGLKI